MAQERMTDEQMQANLAAVYRLVLIRGEDH